MTEFQEYLKSEPFHVRFQVRFKRFGFLGGVIKALKRFQVPLRASTSVF